MEDVTKVEDGNTPEAQPETQEQADEKPYEVPEQYAKVAEGLERRQERRLCRIGART